MPLEASVKQGIEFLIYLHDVKKENYSLIAGARSALSAILPVRNGLTFGKEPTVGRILKGIFKLRPSLPKHVVIYDTNIVIDYIADLPSNAHLLMELLTQKLTTLLCILSGQRAQSIVNLYLDFLHKTDHIFTFYIPKILKTTSPSFHQEPLEFQSFPNNLNICVLECLKDYIQRTSLLREDLEGEPQQLILSYSYPHKPVKSATLARYVKTFLGMAGIDVTVFTTHSTRAASTSKANNMGLNLKDLARAAGWRGRSTFQKHYKFPIITNFGATLLQKYNTS